MSDEQKVATELKNLSVVLVVFVLGISIIVALNFKTASQDGTEKPLVTVPPQLIKELLSKGISHIGLVREADNEIEQVLTLRPDGTCETCEKLVSNQEGATDFLVSPAGTAPSVVPEPLMTVPPQLVKELLSKGISHVGLVDEADNDIEQVLTLRPDGTSETSRKLLPPKLPNQEGATGSLGNRLFDLLVSPATATTGAACPHDCLCSSPGRHCKNTLGSCCKC